MTPHIKRWITGIVAIPILYVVIAYGSPKAFAVLIFTVTLAGMWEYNQMAFGRGFLLEKTEAFGFTVLLFLTVLQSSIHIIFALLTLSVIAVLMLNLLRMKKQGTDLSHVAKVLLGILYIPLLMSHFILIRGTDSGVLWIWFILVMAFTGDTVAYYIGRRFGKRKLLPEVSPGKTVEGTVGLILGSIAGCLLFKMFFFPSLAVGHAAVLGLLGSVTGQLGDLSESALKRAAGVKDSGTILPGHGGILDRLDCLMFITPFVYYYQAFVIQ